MRSAAAREVAPAARGDGPAGRGPEKVFLLIFVVFIQLHQVQFV